MLIYHRKQKERKERKRNNDSISKNTEENFEYMNNMNHYFNRVLC